jgi:hypothetical protein
MRACCDISPLHGFYLMMMRDTFSSLCLLDARDAGRGRRVASRSVFDGLRGGGRHGDVAFGFDLVEGDAEHLAADEVGNVDVLGYWGRHCGDG